MHNLRYLFINDRNHIHKLFIYLFIKVKEQNCTVESLIYVTLALCNMHLCLNGDLNTRSTKGGSFLVSSDTSLGSLV